VRSNFAEVSMKEMSQDSSNSGGYFERPPEKLVLEGYRCRTRGQVTRSTGPWTEAQLLYRGMLGDAAGEQAIIALARFVRTLGQCAACPLRMLRSGSPFICRDETLVLGLIAGLQNGDDPTVDFCLERLCCPQLCGEVSFAAGHFALTLKCHGKMMQPLAVHVLARILAASRDEDDDWRDLRTIH
jgi:hypothetical protein